MLPFQGCRIPICDTEAHADQWWKSLTCCNAHRLHWDDPRRSEMWIRVWAGRIQSLGRDIPTLSQKETCSSWDKKKKSTREPPNQLPQCCCQDHCGCAWLWHGWEAAVPTVYLLASPSKSIGAWGCPTTWPSFPIWWSTTTRILQLVIWRWVLITWYITLHWNTDLYPHWSCWAVANKSFGLPM